MTNVKFKSFNGFDTEELTNSLTKFLEDGTKEYVDLKIAESATQGEWSTTVILVYRELKTT